MIATINYYPTLSDPSLIRYYLAQDKKDRVKYLKSLL